MTKILSKLLDAEEPSFRLGLQKLERASGQQSHDIRLTNEVAIATRHKIIELGLDPEDTTGAELYEALNQKLAESDRELRIKLFKSNTSTGLIEGDSLDSYVTNLNKLVASHKCFAMKASAAKKLFKKNPPKKAMKALGYRSLDSMLKHESLASLYASSRICESAFWLKRFKNDYKKLSLSDFEDRGLTFTALNSPRWEKLASKFVEQRHDNLINIVEAGTLAILPIKNYPAGMLSAMFLLSLAATNRTLASSSYLRLHQVQADFGKLVAQVSDSLPSVNSPIDGQALDWRTVHEFFASSGDSLDPQLVSDSVIIKPDNIFANLSPELAFWHDSANLAWLVDKRIISLNPVDVSLNYINNLSYDNRVARNCQQALWRDLWRRYLQVEVLEDKLMTSIRRELSGPEPALEFVLEDKK